MFLELQASSVACFTSNAELRSAAVLYANGTTAASNLSLTYGYPISEWCVDRVTDFSSVFANLTTFNEPITGWNTSNALTYVCTDVHFAGWLVWLVTRAGSRTVLPCNASAG